MARIKLPILIIILALSIGYLAIADDNIVIPQKAAVSEPVVESPDVVVDAVYNVSGTPLYDEWTHDYRIYGNGERNILVGAGNMNFKDVDNSWGKVEEVWEDIKFPEGKLIENADSLIIKKPDWGEFEVSEDGQTVSLKDKDNVAIITYNTPAISAADYEKPTSTELMGASNLIKAKYTLKNGDLYFDVPINVLGKNVRVWDDTTSSYTLTDGQLFCNSPTTNYDTATNVYIYHGQPCTSQYKPIAQFTFPASLSGTINAVRYYWYVNEGTATAGSCTAVSKLNPYVYNQVTWNVSSTGNNWTAGGAVGDYGAVLYNYCNLPGGAYRYWTLGTDYVWGSTYQWIWYDNGGSNGPEDFRTKDNTFSPSDQPYVYIDYTVSSGATLKRVIINNNE